MSQTVFSFKIALICTRLSINLKLQSVKVVSCYFIIFDASIYFVNLEYNKKVWCNHVKINIWYDYLKQIQEDKKYSSC